MPNTAGTSPDLACNCTNMRSPQPNQASRTPDITYPLVSSTSFSSSSPNSLFPLHDSTIIAEHKIQSSLPISPCHGHEFTPSTNLHRVQAYTEYKHTLSTSIHKVQHTPSTASTQDCFSSLHSHSHDLTAECSFSFRRTSLHD